MKVFISLLCILFSISVNLFGVTPVITFGGAAADEIRDMAEASDGNLVATGIYRQQADFDPSNKTNNQNSKGNADIFVAKYDTTGKLIWVKSIGGTGDDQVTSIFIDFVGDIYLTGSFTGACDFDPSGVNQVKTSKGTTDAFVAKYNSSGDLDWVIAFGGPGIDVANDVYVDIIGSVSVIGTFTGTIDVEPSDAPDAGDTYTSNGNTDIFLVVYSDIGAYETGFSWGGTDADEGTSVTLDDDLNFLIAGSFSGTVDFDTGVNELLLTSAGSTDGFIAKYDLIGNIWWAFKLGGTGEDRVTRNSLASDLLNNIYVAGYFSNTVNFNPGGTANLTSKGKTDVFLAKYDENGIYTWANAIGSANDDKTNSLFLDSQDNIFLSGSFAGTVDFDPSVNTKQVSSISLNSPDGFFAKYDKDCIYQWSCGFGNSDQKTNPINYAAKTLNSNKGTIYSAGTFSPNAIFYNDTQQQNADGPGASDCYISILDKNGKFIIEQIVKELSILTPNGGEIFSIGDEINISWTAKNIDTFNISISTDGTNYTRIFSNVTSSQSPLKWTATNTPSKKCLIEIKGVNDASISDKSDNFFEIKFVTLPTLNLIKPNGSEIIIANTNYDISWQAFNLNQVDIFFSSDNGNQWETLTTKYTASVGKYAWTTKDIYSETCLIKMNNSDDNSELDRSENVFTITNEADINDENMLSISLLPNPVFDVLNLKCDFSFEKLIIYDISGNQRFVQSGPFAGNQISFNVSELENGFYFLAVENKNSKSIISFVKAK